MNEKKVNVIYFGILICTALIVVGHLVLKDSGEKKVFSIREQAKNIYVQKEFIEPEIIFVSELAISDVKEEKQKVRVNDLLRLYQNKFDISPAILGSNIESIEVEHDFLLRQMRAHGVKIDPLINLKPRFRIALNYFIGLELGQMTLSDYEKINLTKKEWYILKTFSESKDFVLMLKRESLSKDFLQINNLAKYYANNS